ncbi:MAG: type II toxin-antitoxin system VapC family toxin [Bacteroidales bacterium]|nr:type II toxin-antitoxin system VapC family toxin [Bacteroidales bacterium]
MSGNKIFVDTNTLIYLLDGDSSLADILNQRNIYISFITQLELLGYPEITEEDQFQIENLLDNCVIIDINNIKTQVIGIKRKYNLKIPDCIIAATAVYLDLPLITSDKEFKKIEELNLMLYEK